MNRIFAFVAALACACLLVAGCGTSTSTAPLAVTPVAGRHAAPPFSVPNLAGGTPISLAALHGHPVLVSFWASWCNPCRTEMPTLEQFARTHPALDVIGLATLDQNGASRAFAQSVGVTYPLGVDADGSILARYGAAALPATAVIDTQGRLISTVYGPLTSADLTAIARQFGVASGA